MVGRAGEVDGDAAGEEGADGGGVAFPCREADRREAAVLADQAGVVQGDGFAGAALGLEGFLGGVPGLGGAGGVGGAAPGGCLRGGRRWLDWRLPALPQRRDLRAAPPLRRAVGDVALYQVHHAGGGRSGRPGLDKRHHGFGPSERRREHEGGLFPLGLPGVYRGTVVEEHRHRVYVTGGGGEVERCCAGLGGRCHVGPGFGQDRDDFAVTLLRGDVEGRVRAQTGRRFEGRPRFDQQLRDLRVSVQGRPVKPGHPVPVGRVDVGAVRKQRTNGLDIVPPGGVGDGGPDGRDGGPDGRDGGPVSIGDAVGGIIADLGPYRHRSASDRFRDRFYLEFVRKSVAQLISGPQDEPHECQNAQQVRFYSESVRAGWW